MTHISLDDVHRLAQLSNLQLKDDEATHLSADLEAILSYFEQLSEIDTSDVEPTYQVTDLQNVWREDTVDNYGISKQELLACAPENEADSVKVPKVL
tara:strand:+ start:1961 stop:2251 length:291 start_codon:yes stop_codon:yes gene_type:complete